MSPVQLEKFNNSWYGSGRPAAVRYCWLVVQALIAFLKPLVFGSVYVTIMRLFGARIGTAVVVKPGIRVKYPWLLVIGDNSWIGEDVWIDNLAPVCLGANVCVSQGVYFCTGNHDWSDPAFGLIVRGIEVKDGAWVGAKAVVAPGVNIGESGVAAAGSVVTKDIGDCEIHAGNPARYVRQRRFRSSEGYSRWQDTKP